MVVFTPLVLLSRILLLVEGVLLQFIDIFQVKFLFGLDAEGVVTILERLLLFLLNLDLLLEELSDLRVLHQLLQLVHRDVAARFWVIGQGAVVELGRLLVLNLKLLRLLQDVLLL